MSQSGIRLHAQHPQLIYQALQSTPEKNFLNPLHLKTHFSTLINHTMGGISTVPHREDENVLKMFKMFNQLWDQLLWSERGMILLDYATEQLDCPIRGLNNRYNQRSDARILAANRDFLLSLESLRETNQNYLNTSQLVFADKSGILTPSGVVNPRQSPTPQKAQPHSRCDHDRRHDMKKSGSMEDVDVDGCAKELGSMGLNGR
jgi:hypothetical protein